MENDSDLFMKNVGQEIYKRHIAKYLGHTSIEDIG
jgi:hypothetical protein